jgi:hypothetical protein
MLGSRTERTHRVRFIPLLSFFVDVLFLARYDLINKNKRQKIRDELHDAQMKEPHVPG